MSVAHKSAPVKNSFISRHQAAKMANVCVRSIDGWVAKGKLRAYQMGARVIFDPDDIRALIRARELIRIKTPTMPSLFSRDQADAR